MPWRRCSDQPYHTVEDHRLPLGCVDYCVKVGYCPNWNHMFFGNKTIWRTGKMIRNYRGIKLLVGLMTGRLALCLIWLLNESLSWSHDDGKWKALSSQYVDEVITRQSAYLFFNFTGNRWKPFCFSWSEYTDKNVAFLHCWCIFKTTTQGFCVAYMVLP